MEIDSVAAGHTSFNLCDDGISVSVKDFIVGDAITRKEGTGYGAVESWRRLGYEHLIAELGQITYFHMSPNTMSTK